MDVCDTLFVHQRRSGTVYGVSRRAGHRLLRAAGRRAVGPLLRAAHGRVARYTRSVYVGGTPFDRRRLWLSVDSRFLRRRAGRATVGGRVYLAEAHVRARSARAAIGPMPALANDAAGAARTGGMLAVARSGCVHDGTALRGDVGALRPGRVCARRIAR